MYKHTKIVCTMGPACDNDDTIREMIKAGMNVARFNFSHGSYEEHHGRIERVKRIADLGKQVVGNALFTDLDDRFQGIGLRTKRSTFFACHKIFSNSSASFRSALPRWEILSFSSAV